MINCRLRYSDLKARGVVNNRQTLKNWIEKERFPPGQLTGPNCRTWSEGEIQEYLDNRPTAPKLVIPAKLDAKRPRGRPPKTIADIEAGAKAKIAAVEAETKAKIAKITAKMENA